MKDWLIGARPATLPAAVVPVVVGTAAVVGDGTIIAWRVVAALIVSLALQIGSNYANDYADGIRGTDSGARVGPVRLVGSGRRTPGEVKRAAFISFAVAGVAGLALAAAVGWELVAVGAAAIAAAWFYTAGPRPYGYAGFGELFVFVFFGLVATIGSTYVHLGRITSTAVLASIPVGLLVTALLVTNNLRDIPSDTESHKRTLAVRLGDTRTRSLYVGLIGGAFVGCVVVALAGRPWAAVALGAAVAAVAPIRTVMRGAMGMELIAVLKETGRLQLVFGVLLALGLML